MILQMTTFSDPSTALSIAFFAVALFYSTVGHRGASGYLAGFTPAIMRPTLAGVLVVAVMKLIVV